MMQLKDRRDTLHETLIKTLIPYLLVSLKELDPLLIESEMLEIFNSIDYRAQEAILSYLLKVNFWIDPNRGDT